MDFFLEIFLGLLELAQALAKTFCQLGQFIRAEKEDREHQDDQPFRTVGKAYGEKRMQHIFSYHL